MSFGGQPKTSSTLFATFGGTSVLADSYGAAAKGGWKHAVLGWVDEKSEGGKIEPISGIAVNGGSLALPFFLVLVGV